MNEREKIRIFRFDYLKKRSDIKFPESPTLFMNFLEKDFETKGT